MWRWFFSLADLAVALLDVAMQALFWLWHGLAQAVVIIHDAVLARRTMKGGRLHCPRGHEIPLDLTDDPDLVLTCEACGFSYAGSALHCSNPECLAPITPYLNCPTCGLSVRNPYRWGRSS